MGTLVVNVLYCLLSALVLLLVFLGLSTSHFGVEPIAQELLLG